MNEMIRVSPVRLIDETGTQLGITETPKALELAQGKGLDLVEISPTAKPPVCKIIDWGKFQYQEAKKLQDARAKQKKIDIKGVRFRPSTDENDLSFKLKQTEKFLLKGSKVKVEVVLRGREKAFANQSRVKLQNFIDKIEIPIKIEQGIKRQFNGFNVLISSNKAD